MSSSPIRARVMKLTPLVCLLAILVLHSTAVVDSFVPAISKVDSNGYWAQASLIAQTGRTWFVPESDLQFVGYHWLITDSGRYYSRYPPGLPVLAAVVYKLFGFRASLMLNPVLSALALVGLYLLIVHLLGRWWAVAGAGLLAANPLFHQQVNWAYSHIAVAFCLIWGLLLLVRWATRGRLWEAFLAGVLFGCIPTIHYPDGALLVGPAAFLLWHRRTHGGIWWHYLAAILGVAIPLAPILVRNHIAFGAFYRTAYAITGEQYGFGLRFIKLYASDFIRGLLGSVVGLLFPLGLVGMTLMCSIRRLRPLGTSLLAMASASTLLYTAFYYSPQAWSMASMRYMLPLIAVYIIGGLWLISYLTLQSSTLTRVSVVAVVLLLQLVWGTFADTENVMLSREKEELARITDALEMSIKPNDIVIASGRIAQHLDFVRLWRLVDSRLITSVGMPGRIPHSRPAPGVPTPTQVEKEDARWARYRGLDTRDLEQLVAEDLLQWAGDKRVYFVGRWSDVKGMRGDIFNENTFRIITRVDVTLPTPVSQPPAGLREVGGGESPETRVIPPGAEMVIAEWAGIPEMRIDH